MIGHIRQRSKGSWAITIDLPRDEDGKRRQKQKTVRGTKREAEQILARMLNEVNSGVYVPEATLTVGAYLDEWLEIHARHNVAAKTFERYQELVTLHIKPAVGRVRLSQLRPPHIARMYSDLAAPSDTGKRPLAPATIVQIHRILRKALQQALQNQILVRNVADAVRPPRVTRQEMKVLAPAQVRQLIDTARGTYFWIPIVLAVTTGMRRGEIVALRWDDVDLAKGALQCQRSLQVTREGIAFKEPKSGRSRAIPLPRQAVEALQVHYAEQAEQRKLLGESFNEVGLVCTDIDGSPLHPDRISDNFRYLLQKAGLPAIRFHDLRHTHATLLLQQGVHAKIVSERLGHSTIGITLDTYSHVLPSMQEEAARQIDRILSLTGDR